MIYLNKHLIKPEYFPDKTFNLKIPYDYKVTNRIYWFYENEEEMALLFYIVSTLRDRERKGAIELYMPYVPNARMDRVKNQDEVFTLKYFANFINSLNFKEVIVRDVHSNVGLALFNNIREENIYNKLQNLIVEIEPDVLFFPDEGSCKRYSCDYPFWYGEKKRDWKTGKILGLDVVQTSFPNAKTVLIIDDICSKGGTFYYSAKKLKEIGVEHIYLYITHCEDTILDGELINSGLIEKIYTTNSIINKAKNTNLIKIEVI